MKPIKTTILLLMVAMLQIACNAGKRQVQTGLSNRVLDSISNYCQLYPLKKEIYTIRVKKQPNQKKCFYLGKTKSVDFVQEKSPKTLTHILNKPFLIYGDIDGSDFEISDVAFQLAEYIDTGWVGVYESYIWEITEFGDEVSVNRNYFDSSNVVIWKP